MATQKFWSQRLFERKEVVKISYEGIAKKCQTTTRSAKNYIKRDINAGLIVRSKNQYLHPIFQRICDGKNTYFLTLKGKRALGKDSQYPPSDSGPPQESAQEQLQKLRQVLCQISKETQNEQISLIPAWWLRDKLLLRKTLQLLFKKLRKGYRVLSPYAWVSKALKDRGVGYRLKIVHDVLNHLEQPHKTYSSVIETTYDRLRSMQKDGLEISTESLLRLLRKGFSHLGQALHSYERLQRYTPKITNPIAFLNYLVSLKEPFLIFSSNQSSAKKIELVKSLLRKNREKIVFLPKKAKLPHKPLEEKLHIQFLIHKHMPERSVLQVFQSLGGEWKATLLKAFEPSFFKKAKTIINAV